MTGKYALVIGNSQYDDPRLAQLSAPGKDAEDLARILRDRDFCAFDDVRVLLNQSEPVVREAIDEFFDEKLTEDLLLLYFSGHGVRDELGALYLAVKNTNRSRLRSTAVKSDFIHEAMEQCRARRQVLILDCCNSGAFEQGTKAATGGSIGIANAFGGYGRVILTASDSLQYAWQGDAVIGSTDNSLFTHFLVEGLRGEAEADGDGIITVDELYDYAYEQVRRATPNQTPSKFSTKQEGEIILRQITQLDQIKAAPLPAPLVESMENPLSAVRLGSVQELARLLKGKNLGLARSAREALESMSEQDDSLSVRKAATDALQPILAAEQEARAKAEQERYREAAEAYKQALAAEESAAEPVAAAKNDANRLIVQKPEPERLAAEQAQAERLAAQQAQAERLARQEGERKRLAEVQAQEERRAAAQAPARPAPWWIPAVWIALGFGISAALTLQFPTSAVVNVVLDGALAGLTVGVVWYLQRTLSQWKSIIWITLGAAAGWAIAGFYINFLLDNGWGYEFSYRVAFSEAISGGVAGIGFALVLIMDGAVPRWDALFRIALAWAFAGLIDGLTFQVLYQGIFNPAGMSLTGPVAIGAALDGAIGSLATIWLIRTESEQAAKVGQEEARTPKSAGQVITGERSQHPKWLAVLWIALGFGISAVLVSAPSLDQFIGIALYGALAGLAVAVVLRLEHALRDWTTVLWVTLGWLLGWAILGMIVQVSGWNYDPSPEVVLIEPFAGAIAGLTLALVLRREGTVSRDDMVWITLVWALAAGLDGLVFRLLFLGIFDPAGMAPIIPLAISAALDGALGSLVTVWRIRRAKAKSIPALLGSSAS